MKLSKKSWIAVVVLVMLFGVAAVVTYSEQQKAKEAEVKAATVAAAKAASEAEQRGLMSLYGAMGK